MKSVQAIVCASAAVLAVVVGPARAESILRWVSSVGITSWDPAFDDLASARGFAAVYGGLTLSGADLALRPGLATEWTLAGATRWRFVLRPGVLFHDGTPFTAEDVVFSLDRARHEGSDAAGYFASIATVTAVDARTVEVETRQPDLLLPVRLKNVHILSKAWAERHGAEHLPPQATDASTYTFAHANGTGPFVLESFKPGVRTVLVKNPTWWGSKQYPYDVDRIVWTAEPDPERRLAPLLNGTIDLVTDVPLDEIDRVRGRPDLKLARTPGLLSWFLGMDQASAELRGSDVKGRNPFKDRRVRQALYHAIDVDTLIGKTLGGLAVPAGMLAAPLENGYDPELDRRLPYDPGRAKALLAEAGYPDGFAVRLNCSTAKRMQCAELATQLAVVGVRVAVDALPYGEHRSRLAARGADMYFEADMAGFTFDTAELLRDIYHSPSSYWQGATGYANPVMDALLDRIDGELATYPRDGLLEQAWRMALDDITVVPLYRPLQVWAMREGLDLPIGPTSIPYFFEARLAAPREGPTQDTKLAR